MGGNRDGKTDLLIMLFICRSLSSCSLLSRLSVSSSRAWHTHRLALLSRYTASFSKQHQSADLRCSPHLVLLQHSLVLLILDQKSGLTLILTQRCNSQLLL